MFFGDTEQKNIVPFESWKYVILTKIIVLYGASEEL